MRSHNYKLGENQLNYETTAHRVEHNNRVLEPNHQPERSVEEARLDLGKHHYDLGGEDGARTTTHQRTFDKKVIFHHFLRLVDFQVRFRDQTELTVERQQENQPRRRHVPTDAHDHAGRIQADRLQPRPE